MPQEIPKEMIFTGLTDQFLGRQYECPVCHKKYWSAWGWARRHWKNCKDQ